MRFEFKQREAKLYTHNMNLRVNPAYSIAIKSGLKCSKFLMDHQDTLEDLFFLSKSTETNKKKQNI